MIWAISLAFFIAYIADYFSYWIRNKIPYIPPKYPYFWGSISKDKNPALQYADFYEMHRGQPLVGIFMLWKRAILILDRRLVISVMNENFHNFRNRGMFYNEKDDPLSALLGTLEGETWNALRKQLTPAFTPAKLKGMFPSLQLVGEQLVEGMDGILQSGNEVEIRRLFSRYTTDVIGNVMIGIDSNTLTNTTTPLREMARQAMIPHLKFPLNIFTVTCPKVARFLRIRKHDKEVSDYFMNVVRDIIEMREDAQFRRNDFMQLLIDSNISTESIAAISFDLLSAGYADSTSTLAYCLYELSLPENRHIQTRAREEIRTVLAQHEGKLTFDAWQQMTYCKCIIDGKYSQTLKLLIIKVNFLHLFTSCWKCRRHFLHLF